MIGMLVIRVPLRSQARTMFYDLKRYFLKKTLKFSIQTYSKKFDAFLTSIIEEHNSSSKNEKHKNLLSILLSLKDERDDHGNHLTDTEIKALLRHYMKY
ncbi:Flavonoid 3'-monooxygenase [Glycine soja]|uniref:Flavonoid 3'-monooxygenase n=1 Tax=Glycine soja TaxID=3848 RepID=A0A0B2QCX2_GLYSO|nr:Flavonoid 3'-monooxygenase [Glycine soja]